MTHMTRTFLSLASFALIASGTVAQCVPDPLYQDSIFGVWPDTVENFNDGTVGLFYSDTLNLKIPQDAGDIDPDYAGFMLDSVQFDGVGNLPPGLSVICNSQTPAPCTYLTGILGCGLIEGTPTAAGSYALTLDVTAYASLLGNPVPVPYSFSGYEITIDPGTGVMELAVDLGGVRNTPNPFSGRTTIEFTLSRATPSTITVFDLLGERIWKETMAGRAGVNKVNFDGSSLGEGIYLYQVEAAGQTFTGRMVVHR